MKFSLTKSQAECLEFIREYIAAHGYAPTYTEIQSGLEVRSKNSVHRLVSALEQRGHIRRIRACARSITIVGDESTEDQLKGLLREIACSPTLSRAQTAAREALDLIEEERETA